MYIYIDILIYIYGLILNTSKPQRTQLNIYSIATPKLMLSGASLQQFPLKCCCFRD